jgi:hypothetical protein
VFNCMYACVCVCVCASTRWENAMVLNCPYVVFGQDLDVIQKIKTIREKHSLPTVYVYRNITEHMSPRFHRFKRRYVSREVPSKEVAVIW